MFATRLTEDEIKALEAASWVRCDEPYCVFESTHWHDKDGEETVFLHRVDWSALETTERPPGE